MTPVKFKFLTPLGNPIANQEFHVSLNKAAIHSLDNGFVHPEVITTITDAQGEATLELFPADQPYYVTMDVNADINGEQCCTGIRFRIAVPDLDTLVWADKLVVRDPIFSKPWDAEAIEIIMAAKAAAAASAAAAKESELIVVEKAAEVASNTQIVVDNTALAVDAAARAATSETNAKNSETAAGLSQTAAHTSELAAGNSATTAAQKAGEAAASVLQAQEYTSQSQASAVASDLSHVGAVTAADTSAASATASANSATTSTTNANKTAADVVTVTGLRNETTGLRDEAQIARDEAVAAAGAATGAFVDGGLIDLSGGAYPAKPLVSTIWRVTVGGTVTSTPEGTITYRAGDNLVYTKTNDVFYKTDNSQAVVSVNGRQGLVILDKTDVGLNKVDNTTDMDKPVSNAQQTQFNLRTPTSTNLDKTAGRLTKVGDYGENGGPPIARISTDDANNLTVSATYAFTDGGANVPEAAYVKHIGHGTVGYAKQIAYGILTDKQYVRTQVNSVWSNWTSAVEIIDALTSTDPTKALSAKQGKVLYDLIQAGNSTISRYTYSLASGVTVISGADSGGKVLTYVPGTPMIVDKDGFAIQMTKDYTASNGTSLVLAAPTEQACQITIIVFGIFSVADHYTKGEIDLKFQGVVRENVIINGNFSLWQRGTSFVNPPHFTNTADRWVFGQSSGNAQFTVSQSTDVPNGQSQFSMNIAVNQAFTPTAYTEAHIRYGLEGRQGLVKIAGKVVTYSFWAKSNVIGTHSLVMVHPNADRTVEETYVAEYTILAANTWEKKTVTVDLGTATGGWSYIGGNYGLKIRFTFYAGSAYRAQPGQWTIGNFVGSVNSVNLAATVGNYLRIAQFKLEVGNTASAFEPEDIVDTLLKCQRYYYIMGGVLDSVGLTGYAGGVGETQYTTVNFPTTMCKVPTTTQSAPFALINCGQPTFTPSQNGTRILLTALGAGRMAARSDAAYLAFDAEF